MKKLLLLLVFSIFLVGTISAFEFDNSYTYDSINNEITFKNTFLHLYDISDIAKAKLDTPQVNYVMSGRDRRVAEITIDSYVAYEEFIKGMELIDLNTNEEIQRDINYKYKEITYYEIDVNDYKEVCSISKNETKICNKEIIGTHKETKENVNWIPLEKLDLKQEKITIGLFTDVYAGDKVEWYPTMFGQKVTEWATWISNAGIITYYKLNETSGTSALESVYGAKNLTTTNGLQVSYGKIGYAYKFNTEAINTGYGLDDYASNGRFSMSFWFKPNASLTSDRNLISNSAGAGSFGTFNGGMGIYVLGANFRFRLWDSSTQRIYDTPNYATTEWTMYTWLFNTTNMEVYINGNKTSTNIALSSFAFSENVNIILGGVADNSQSTTNTLLDEIGMWNRTLSATEITDLYNLGAGISYEPTLVPVMTATASQPVNHYNSTTTRTITLGVNCSGGGGESTTSVRFALSNGTNYTIDNADAPSYNATWSSTYADGTYNWTGTCFGSSGQNDTTASQLFTVAIPYPKWLFNYQTPADLSTLNSIVNGLNISYNWTAYPYVNISTIKLYYKVNSSTSNIQYYQNGTANSGYFLQAYNNNITNDTYVWRLQDNSYLPGTYNSGEITMENTAHNFNTLASSQDFVWIELQNVSNSTTYGFFEIMANKTVNTGQSANLYYCNNTYTTGSPASNTNCYLYNVIIANVSYNHNHDGGYSAHQAESFVPNTTSGKIGTVQITSTSYFLLQGSGGTWNYGYINGTARAGAYKTSANGGTSWTTNNTIIVDAHLHQFEAATTIYYYSTANSTYDISYMNTTDVRNDLLNLTGLAPTAPIVTSPTIGNYSGFITINYTASVSPNSYAISFYNITLLNSTFDYISTIRTNNSLNLSYTWDASLTIPGNYFIQVKAYDNVSQTSIGTSEEFTIPFGFYNNAYNTSTYETSYESYSINLSEAVPALATSVKVIYAGLGNYSATKTGNFYNTNILLPTSIGNKTWYWEVVYNGATYTSTTYYQYVNDIDFRLCNATNNITYMNVTFADELTSAAINGTLSSFSTTYYLYNSSSYNTYTTTNTSLSNPNYGFCFSPVDKTIQTEVSGSSLMTGYPLRNWQHNYNLTNTSTMNIVYLLAAADGIYQNVIVTNNAGTAIQGAVVTATYGTIGIVDTRTTDVNGQVSLWLDPNKPYVLTTSATGYPSDIRTINPSSTVVYVTLGGTSTYPANLTVSSTEGIVTSITPSNSTLFNDTAYDFTFTVTSPSLTVSSFGYRLYNTTGNQVATVSAVTNGGTVTSNYDVGNNTQMRMEGYYIVNGTTSYVTKKWIVVNTGDTQYSVLFLKNRIITYLDSGFFGLSRGFGLNIICFVIIFITVGTFSWKYGISNDTTISVMTLLMVWLFEFGLGLIYVGTAVPLTFWAAIVTVGLLIKEGMKLI